MHKNGGSEDVLSGSIKRVVFIEGNEANVVEYKAELIKDENKRLEEG